MIGFRISETRRGLFSPGIRFDLLPFGRPLTPEAAEFYAGKAPKPGSGMTDDDSPIGIVDGKVNQVEKDAPPFKPTIVDDKGNVIEGDPDAEDEEA